MINPIGRRAALRGTLSAAALGTAALGAATAPARAARPITIGLSLSLTGPLAVAGRAILVTARIFESDFNGQGGINGTPIRFVYYDDQSNAANIPEIYTKLLEIDHVDLLMCNATNLTAAAMPVVIQHQRVMVAMFSLAVNDKFHYPRYFQTMPFGPDGRLAISEGFFAAAAALVPKAKTIAFAGADADFAKTAVSGARENAQKLGLKPVYDRSYPPTTVDYDPIVRVIAAARPDIVYIGSYPFDTVGILRSVHSVGLRARLFGGGMVGTQIGSLKATLGPALNGVLSFELYVPAVAKFFPDVEPFLVRYRPLAVKAGVDPLGFYMPPFAYASFQALTEAVRAVGLDQAKLAAHMHAVPFRTMVGEIRFGADGEWAKGRMLQAQFRGVAGHDVKQFLDPAREVVIEPAQYASGALITPFGGA